MARSVSPAGARPRSDSRSATQGRGRDVRYELSFSGCGGLWSYLLGIASVIQQERMDPLELQAYAASGCSGGVYPAVAVATGYPARDIFEYVVTFIDECGQKSWTGALWNYNHFAKKGIDAFWLQDFAVHQQRMTRKTPAELSGSFAVALTRLSASRGLEGMIISEWESTRQIAEANIATHAIPGLLDPPWRLGHRVGGDLMVDGGLGGLVQPRAFDGTVHLAIHPQLWRDFPVHWSWPSCDKRWLEYLYELGRSDCHARLQLYGPHADLGKVLEPEHPDCEIRRTFPSYLGASMAWRVWFSLKLLPPGLVYNPVQMAWRVALLFGIVQVVSRRWWAALVKMCRVTIGACYLACHLCLKTCLDWPPLLRQLIRA